MAETELLVNRCDNYNIWNNSVGVLAITSCLLMAIVLISWIQNENARFFRSSSSIILSYQWCLLGCLLCLARLSVINWCLFWCSVGCAIFSLICIPFWGANITYKNVYLWLMCIVHGSFFIDKINIFDSCVCSHFLDLCVRQKHQIKVFAICPAIWLAWICMCVCVCVVPCVPCALSQFQRIFSLEIRIYLHAHLYLQFHFRIFVLSKYMWRNDNWISFPLECCVHARAISV